MLWKHKPIIQMLKKCDVIPQQFKNGFSLKYAIKSTGNFILLHCTIST